MSREDVELIRELTRAFNAREDGWADHYHPDAEFHMPREWPEDRVYRGPEGVLRSTELWSENFDEYRWDDHELIDAGDFVVGLFRHGGRSKGSAEWIENEIGAIFEIRSGKIARVRTFLSWAETREAAGLS